MEKAYSPKPIEEKWVKLWAEANLFRSKSGGSRDKSYVIVIPPPNVTGALHIGHALNNSLQDVLIRYHRLKGLEVCWVPGTDHGGIATQSVMEKQLKSEGSSRHALGREEFLKRMDRWVEECKSTILGQLKRLGCALDWDREAFTMDEVRAKAVFEAFKRLWDKRDAQGNRLIYRGLRVVNWCIRCETALSDIEVEHDEAKGHLWHIHYPRVDGSRGVVVATTRPETMLGDTAVAVHPEDVRYKGLVGGTLRLPLMDREIPVIADDSVDKDFGTGAVKVTPAHDFNDFEIRERHPEIKLVQVIGPNGRMTQVAGAYHGLSREEARKRVVADLGELLEKTEDHPLVLGTCYRCNQIIEPLASDQWFVNMRGLADRAVEATESGRVRIYPDSWNKPYLEWLRNIKDWCISRQIWWGHRIPIWYCWQCQPEKEFEPILSVGPPAKCPKCGNTKLEQDKDVLDTWFSSALWPFSVFGWPEKTGDLAFYYPTTVLVTGYEILYLWVARMVMAGLEFLGEVPYRDVYIHGIVRDKRGKKMSKSLGNVIDPLVMMDKYGTDALRFSLITQAYPGKDIPFAEESITGSRNFANKLWNTARFVEMNLSGPNGRKGLELSKLKPSGLELADAWILAEYQVVVGRVQEQMGAYDLATAADALYQFVWDGFCDWYVELSKIRLQGGTEEEKRTVQAILYSVLEGSLVMLHPFMPFLTEELHSVLGRGIKGEEEPSFLWNRRWPELKRDWSNPGALAEMSFLMEVTRSIRTVRSQLNVPPSLKAKVYVSGGEDGKGDLLARHAAYVAHLARLESLEPWTKSGRLEESATAIAAGMSFYLPLSGLIDLTKERMRLQKQRGELAEELGRWEAKASDERFLRHAAAEEVSKVKRLRDETSLKLKRLEETLQSLG